MTKEVLLVTGAGQIGLAIVRRMGYGKKIVIAAMISTTASAISRAVSSFFIIKLRPFN